jgi:hypothetical protein
VCVCVCVGVGVGGCMCGCMCVYVCVCVRFFLVRHCLGAAFVLCEAFAIWLHHSKY